MMNQTYGWMGGWAGGGMWIWTVIGALVVVLLDVDNTLLNNDRFAADPGARLQEAFGAVERERFLAVKRVVVLTEWGLDGAARVGSAKQEAR
jgi:hypothetical protein